VRSHAIRGDAAIQYPDDNQGKYGKRQWWSAECEQNGAELNDERSNQDEEKTECAPNSFHLKAYGEKNILKIIQILCQAFHGPTLLYNRQAGAWRLRFSDGCIGILQCIVIGLLCERYCSMKQIPSRAG